MVRLLERAFIREAVFISEFLKIELQIFHMRLKIKYHPSIFKKYRIFNIDEHMLRTKRQSTFYRLRVTHIIFSFYELDKTEGTNQV